MATYKFYLISLSLTWLVCISNAEHVQHAPCESNPGDCTVHEVRVVPCPESEEHKPCKVKRGKTATISFDFTTQWEATTAHGELFSADDEEDLPLNGMNMHNACQFTSCPIRASTKQSYTYTLPLAKKFPVGTYTIRWVLRNAAKPEETNERCCFTTKIKLTK
ncbi:MD-2-related lipid-recognition protein-like [Sitodiplosis mosellana]|uniref:MD-2-related lipid-recognition protein-like n=1 Tax=Sitodiplosis mosellana TaxID=263140 RepID=UPI002443777F|nr:MD-2-related lipid-recognition protein-like [Sitodiplosis mosellana]